MTTEQLTRQPLSRQRPSLRREMLREQAFQLHISGHSVREIASALAVNKSTVCNYLANEAKARAQEFALQRSALIAQSVAVFRHQQRILMELQRSNPRYAVPAAKTVMIAQSKIDILLGLTGVSGTPAAQIALDPTDHVADDANRKLLIALAAAT